MRVLKVSYFRNVFLDFSILPKIRFKDFNKNINIKCKIFTQPKLKWNCSGKWPIQFHLITEWSSQIFQLSNVLSYQIVGRNLKPSRHTITSTRFLPKDSFAKSELTTYFIYSYLSFKGANIDSIFSGPYIDTFFVCFCLFWTLDYIGIFSRFF